MKKFEIVNGKRKDYVQFTMRIESDLLEQAKKIIIDNDLKSINSFLNECIRFAISNFES